MRSAAPVTQNHLSKPTDLMLQNATPLRKSAPWPPNISHEHVFCTASATENASLQILLQCPTPAIVCGNAAKPHVLLTFDKVHNPLHLPRETSSECPKVVRGWCALYILTWKCASRHNGVHFFDISTYKKSGPTLKCFVHFDFEMCFAPQRRALFRHLNLQKWSDNVVFVHFHFEMCFAPQWRALFRHLNFQKCSETQVFCTFSLGNLLRATSACNF